MVPQRKISHLQDAHDLVRPAGLLVPACTWICAFRLVYSKNLSGGLLCFITTFGKEIACVLNTFIVHLCFSIQRTSLIILDLGPPLRQNIGSAYPVKEFRNGSQAVVAARILFSLLECKHLALLSFVCLYLVCLLFLPTRSRPFSSQTFSPNP